MICKHWLRVVHVDADVIHRSVSKNRAVENFRPGFRTGTSADQFIMHFITHGRRKQTQLQLPNATSELSKQLSHKQLVGSCSSV